MNILIVEDEPLVAMLLESFVEELGHKVIGTASNIQDAMQATANWDFDVALLDLNLHGQKAHALPGILLRRAKPFAFVTGYGQQGVLDLYSKVPVVAKPFNKEAIAEALALLQN